MWCTQTTTGCLIENPLPGIGQNTTPLPPQKNMGYTGVFPKRSRIFVKFSEFSKFR